MRIQRHDCLMDQRLAVLDLLGFIQEDVEPSPFALKELDVSSEKLIRGNDDSIVLEGICNDLLFTLCC